LLADNAASPSIVPSSCSSRYFPIGSSNSCIRLSRSSLVIRAIRASMLSFPSPSHAEPRNSHQHLLSISA
jgi:hypothetical protein